MAELQVAQTILEQLGGNRFLRMTGAKTLVGGPNFLQFKLPARFAKNSINSVRITLNGSDLYDLQFHRVQGASACLMAHAEDVYAEDLRETLRTHTGLETVMPRIER